MSSDEFDLFLAYSYLFGNKHVKSKLSIFLVFLMHQSYKFPWNYLFSSFRAWCLLMCSWARAGHHQPYMLYIQCCSGSVSHLMALHSDCKETFFTVWDDRDVMLIMWPVTSPSLQLSYLWFEIQLLAMSSQPLSGTPQSQTTITKPQPQQPLLQLSPLKHKPFYPHRNQWPQISAPTMCLLSSNLAATSLLPLTPPSPHMLLIWMIWGGLCIMRQLMDFLWS
jgi:hypothetical protein